VARGHNRERAVKLKLQDDDWFVVRTAGSFGDADLVALKTGHQPRLIEVKSTAGGPYEHFGPTERETLRLAAELAGASAELAWWPPRGQLRFIPANEWP
jgi:Holliday junction resolvase